MKHVLVSLLVHRKKKTTLLFLLFNSLQVQPIACVPSLFPKMTLQLCMIPIPMSKLEQIKRRLASIHQQDTEHIISSFFLKKKTYNLVVALSLSTKPASHFAINTEGVHTSSQEGESRQPGVHTWGNEHFTGSFNLCNPTCTLSPCCLAVTLWYSACRQFRHWLENQGAALARHPLN